MLNNHALNESGRILRLNWVPTGDPFRPLASSWSLGMPDAMQMIRTPDLSEICNAAVIEKCKTSGIPSRQGGQMRSLTMCGK
jgi:hypothetical protein